MKKILLLAIATVGCLAVLADSEYTLSGTYVSDQEIVSATDAVVTLDNAIFNDARLKLSSADETVPVTFTLYLPEGSFNQFNRLNGKDYCIKATKSCNLVIDGPGTLEVYSSKTAKGDGLVNCTDLTVRDGDIRIEFDNDKSDTPCILLKGSYLQTAGKLKVKSAKKNCTNELCGVYFDTRESTFTLKDGKFNAEMAGTKSRAIDMKKSGTVLFDGGECKMEFEGPECRFISGGTNIVFNGGKFNFTTNVTAKMVEPFLPVNCAAVKSDWEININGGKFTVDLPLSGSEIFTMESGSHISVTGGELDLLSGDDCFHATKDIFISGGTIKGESVHDDVLDANGGSGHGITISGGYVRALASDVDTHGFDVNNNGTLTISGGIVIATDGVDTKMIGDASQTVGSVDFRQKTYYATLKTDDYSGESIYLEGESNGVAIVKSPHLPVFAPGKEFNLLLSVPGRADDIRPEIVNTEVVFLLNDGTPSPRDVVETIDTISGHRIAVLPDDPQTSNEEILGFIGWSTNKDDRVARIDTDWIVGNDPTQYVYAVWRYPAQPVGSEPEAVAGLVYDGTAKTGVTVGSDYTVTGNVATNAGGYTAHATPLDGFVWTDGSSDEKSIAWSIAKGTYDLSGVTFPSKSFREDGSAHSIAVVGTLPKGVEVVYEGVRESSAVGTNTVTASFRVTDPANWNAITTKLTAKLVIVSRTSDFIPIDVPPAVEDLVYDGHIQTGVVIQAECLYDGAVATNAGDYVALVTPADGYKWDDGTTEAKSIAWSIAKGTYDLSGVTFPSATFTADGKPHSIAIAGKLPAGVSVVYEGATSRTAVGSQTVTARFTVADPVNWNAIAKTLTATLTIEAKDAVAPSAVGGLVYTGAEQTGVPEGTGYVVTGNTAVAAGSYTAVAELKAGYIWSDGTTAAKSIVWSIAKGTYDMSGVRFPSASFVADGEPHSIAVMGRIPQGVEVVYDGETTRTDIGTNTVTAAFTVLDPANWNAIATKLTATIAITSGKHDPQEDDDDDDDDDDPSVRRLAGYYESDVVIEATNDLKVVLSNAVFTDCQLRLEGDYVFTLELEEDSLSTFSQTATNRPCILAKGGADVVIAGDGVLEVYATKKLASGEGLIACDDFTMSGGDVNVEFDNDKSKTPCILVRGDFRQTGGKLKVKSAKKNCDNELVGVKLNTAGKTFTVDGGEFHAEIAGTGGRAVDLADGCDAYFNDGEFKMEFEGPNGRFICGGEDIVFKGGDYSFVTNLTAKMTNELYHPLDLRAVKAGRSISVFGGKFTAELPLAGSRFFSTDNKSDAFIAVSGGQMSVLTGGECFKTDGSILIAGGEITAASLADDAFSAGPDLMVSGGKLCAFALSRGRHGLLMDDLGTLTIRGGCVVSVDGSDAEIIGADVFRTGFTSFLQPTYYATVSAKTYSGMSLALEGRSGERPIIWTPRMPALTSGSRVNLLVSVPGREAVAPEASDIWPLTTVSFLSSDGFDTVYAEYDYISGHAIGKLPVPPGRTALFRGWAVDPEGTRLVGSGWIVPSCDQVSLYAIWSQTSGPVPAESPELFADDIGAFTGAAETYNGWLRDPVTESVNGLIQVKASAAKGDKPAAVTVTVTPLGGKKKSVKTTVASVANPVDGFGILYGSRGLAGTVAGLPGIVDGSIVEASVDYSKSKNATAKARLGEIPQGGWSFAFEVKDGGYDLLSVTVSKKGKASVKGTLSDGTAFSQSVQGALGDEFFAVPVSYSKKLKLKSTGVKTTVTFACVVWIRLADGAAFVGDAAGDRWKGSFSGRVAASGLADGVHSLVIEPLPWTGYLTLVDGYSVTPDGETVTVANGKPSVGRTAGSVAFDKSSGTPYLKPARGKAPSNLAKLKLTYTKKTGLVKGSYKAYRIVGGKLKTETVNLSGAVIDGFFYGNAVFKNQGVVSIGWWN